MPSLTYVTITGDFLGGDGTPLSGTATFTPSQSVYSAGQEIVTPDVPIAGQITDGHLLSESGGALQLLATDNAGLTFLTLSGFFYWSVVVTVGGLTEPEWSFGLPSSPSTVDLFARANMPFSGGGGVASVTAADTSVVIGGTGTAPTVRTGTLDVIATQHPPAASWSNNGKKITSGAVGTVGTDFATFGQIPAGGNTATIGQGGTGQATQQAALNALAGGVTSGRVLRGDGTNVSLSALQASDIPNLSASYDAAGAATAVASAVAAEIGAASGIASLDSGTHVPVAQLPAATTGARGAVQLDGTAGDITALGATAAAGSTGKAADAGHQHPASGTTWAAYLAPKVVTLTDASTVLVNAALGNDFRLLLTASGHTVGAPSNPVDGQAITIDVQQPSSGGPYTVTWASGAGGYSFGTDGSPTLSTGASAVDTIGFRYHGGLGKWICLGWKLGFS